MTDADNKMSVNLHENGKQQESQSRIINSFVAASGTLIIILCSLCWTPAPEFYVLVQGLSPSPCHAAPSLTSHPALSCPHSR